MRTKEPAPFSIANAVFLVLYRKEKGEDEYYPLSIRIAKPGTKSNTIIINH
jgi:hypothetical protein